MHNLLCIIIALAFPLIWLFGLYGLYGFPGLYGLIYLYTFLAYLFIFVCGTQDRYITNSYHRLLIANDRLGSGRITEDKE